MRGLDRLAGRIAEAVGWEPPWYADLVDYYRVTPAQALELGTRRRGRRPDLPGSPTCPPVSGKTWEELWNAHPRDSEEAIFAFYREIGSWSAFRQVIRHRFRSWGFVARHLPTDGTLVEFGCGIAPISHWIATHEPGRPRFFFLTDVPSEHFTFGQHRLRGKAAFLAVPVRPGTLPELPRCDVACILEVLEHVPDPVAVIRHVGAAIRPGGVLFEDFHRHDAESDGPDLPSARTMRPEVYRHLGRHFAFEAGRPWDADDGGGTRRWRKR